MSTIYFVLAGGLGNQMFQYAAGRALALKYGYELRGCTYYYDDRINADRSYSLKNLNLPDSIKIATVDEERQVKKKLEKFEHSLLSLLVRKLPDFIKDKAVKTIAKSGITRPLFGTYKYITFELVGKKYNNAWRIPESIQLF